MFACTQCNIAYFFSLQHLQKHHEECISSSKMQSALQEIRLEMGEQGRLLQLLVDTLHGVQTQVQEIYSRAPRGRPRKRGRGGGGGADDDEDALSTRASLTTNTSWMMSPEKQLTNAIGFFRKRKVEFPISLDKITEVEELLNDLVEPPEIDFEQFRQEVKDNTSVILSLLEEFKQVIQNKTNLGLVEKDDDEDEGDEDEEEEEEEDDDDESSAADLWFSRNGLSAGDVTASLEASGGAHRLLLQKFLDIFHEGMKKYNARFPMMVFDLGQRRRILKFNERAFSLKDEPLPEGGIRDEDNILCFPFFVYISAQIGWKVLRFTDHIYPLFLLIQSTILKRGVEHSNSMMTREEKRVSDAFSWIGSIKTDQTIMLTRKLEAEYSERLQMTTKLNESVLQFMMLFRKKFFDDFLQTLYQEYSLPADTIYQQRKPKLAVGEKEEEEEEGSPPRSSKFSSRASSRKKGPAALLLPGVTANKVYVFDDEEEIYSEDDS